MPVGLERALRHRDLAREAERVFVLNNRKAPGQAGFEAHRFDPNVVADADEKRAFDGNGLAFALGRTRTVDPHDVVGDFHDRGGQFRDGNARPGHLHKARELDALGAHLAFDVACEVQLDVGRNGQAHRFALGRDDGFAFRERAPVGLPLVGHAALGGFEFARQRRGVAFECEQQVAWQHFKGQLGRVNL